MQHINDGYYAANRIFDTSNTDFFDVRNAPFKIYGLYDPCNRVCSGGFKRIPEEVAKSTNERVALLYTNPAGGRVRFITNSPNITIRASFGYISHRSIMSLLVSLGFDVYVKHGGGEKYVGSINPPIDVDNSYTGKICIGNGGIWREITVYMPLYNDLDSLEIGIEKGYELKAADDGYLLGTPVVYYGSSITQGASASRPGNAYEAIVSRMLPLDFLNLGFAGAACGEDTIADYMATLPMCAFVSDYDHNAPTAEHLKNTHYKLYSKIRAAHPDIPYVMMSRPTVISQTSPDVISRRLTVMDTYRRAFESGDRNVYFIDGFSLFEPPYAENCYADGIHPNDAGFQSMAEKVGFVLERALEVQIASRKR